MKEMTALTKGASSSAARQKIKHKLQTIPKQRFPITIRQNGQMQAQHMNAVKSSIQLDYDISFAILSQTQRKNALHSKGKVNRPDNYDSRKTIYTSKDSGCLESRILGSNFQEQEENLFTLLNTM